MLKATVSMNGSHKENNSWNLSIRVGGAVEKNGWGSDKTVTG